MNINSTLRETSALAKAKISFAFPTLPDPLPTSRRWISRGPSPAAQLHIWAHFIPGFALEASLQQKSQFTFPSHATSQNFLRVSRSPSHAGQGSLINHNLWSQTLKLLELGVKGEAPLLAGHSPGQVRNPTWLPRDHPGHLEKAPGEHQPSSCLPACLVDGGRTRKQQPMEEGGCRNARIKATSCFQTPSKREHTPSPTSEHPSTRMSLPETTELVPLCRGPQKLLCPTSQSPFPSPVAAGPARGPGKHNQHCVFKTTSVQMLFPW